MTINSLTIQKQKTQELISRINRPVDQEWKTNSRGYSLRKPGTSQFGFVRFNVARENAHKYTIYAYQPFSDPKDLFIPTKAGREGRSFADPSDVDGINYAISVLESAWDGRN